jgi:hypothetical protein
LVTGPQKLSCGQDETDSERQEFLHYEYSSFEECEFLF